MGTLTRLSWMLFGPLGIFITLLGISKQPEWTLGIRDLSVAGFMMFALWMRRVDILRYHGTTANGAPATPRDFSRYAVLLVAMTACAWVAVHMVEL